MIVSTVKHQKQTPDYTFTYAKATYPENPEITRTNDEINPDLFPKVTCSTVNQPTSDSGHFIC